MSLMHVSDLGYRHPVQPEWLLRNITFDINPGDRIGLIGPNGSGKTTLLRLLAGELEDPQGAITRRRELAIAHVRQRALDQHLTLEEHVRSGDPALAAQRRELDELEQQLDAPPAALRYATVLSAYAAAGGYELEARTSQVLKGLGLPLHARTLRIEQLSGGERTRAELAKALLTPAELLLLDEPTNHLDAAARRWLERYIATLDAAVIFVSHDRRFLQLAATRILEIRRTKLTSYSGGYDWYREQRALQERQQLQQHVAQERRASAARQAAQARMRLASRVSDTPAGIRLGKDFYAAKAARVERTAKVITARIAREVEAPKPFEQAAMSELRFAAPRAASGPVLELDRLAKSYGGDELFADVSLQLVLGQRIAICGPNGCGKSTLLRIVVGELEPDRGRVAVARSAHIGYFAQDAANLDGAESPLEHCRRVDPQLADAHAMLARLRMPMDRMHRPVGELSAGEQVKVALALVLLASPTILVLDEPTNHLDLDTQEAIESALAEFAGALLLVSHDRYLVERLADEVIDLASYA